MYTPTAGYVGPDAFSYTANDALVPSAITTVSIDVTPVNHAPTLGLVIDQTIPEMVLFNLTLSGADPDGDTPLTYSVPTAPTGLSVGQATGVLDWTPTEAQGARRLSGHRPSHRPRRPVRRALVHPPCH